MLARKCGVGQAIARVPAEDEGRGLESFRWVYHDRVQKCAYSSLLDVCLTVRTELHSSSALSLVIWFFSTLQPCLFVSASSPLHHYHTGCLIRVGDYQMAILRRFKLPQKQRLLCCVRDPTSHTVYDFYKEIVTAQSFSCCNLVYSLVSLCPYTLITPAVLIRVGGSQVRTLHRFINLYCFYLFPTFLDLTMKFTCLAIYVIFIHVTKVVYIGERIMDIR